MGHPSAVSDSTYKEDTNREVMDLADFNTSFLAKENNSNSGQLAYVLNDGSFSSSYVGITNPLRASIGIFAIKGSISKSGKTTLGSNISSAFKIKVSKPQIFSSNLPKYRMYIKGKNSAIARIDYQVNYEGSLFRIKIGNENEDYISYFDSSKTYINPAELYSISLSAMSNDVFKADIRDVIDFNANDNNLSKMLIDNKFDIKDDKGIYNQDLRDLRSSTLFSAIAYRLYEKGNWEVYNSKNFSSSNDFNSFETGKGYWLKIHNGISSSNDGLTKTALISRSSVDINNEQYSNIKDGWNLLSFNDTHIRYSPTGVFIPDNLFVPATSSGLTIYSKSHSFSDSQVAIILNNAYTNSVDGARAVNILSQAKADLYGFQNKIRAIPAIKIGEDSSETVGIIVISDKIFDINTSGNTANPITTLSGDNIQSLANNIGYSSVYGEYLNFIDINELNGTDINASFSLQMPKYNSSHKFAYDLNDSNKTKNLAKILRAFNDSATKNGQTTASAKTAGYLTTLNFNTTTDYNISSSMSTMILSSGERYIVSDNTHVRVYKLNNNGNFKIKSSFASIDIKLDNNEKNITKVINAINNQRSQSNVVATYVGIDDNGDEQFMISSTKDGIELLEDDIYNLFDDISLSSSEIAHPSVTKGYALASHTFSDLLMLVVFNRGIIDGVGETISSTTSDGTTDGTVAPTYTGGVAKFTGSLVNINGAMVVDAGDTLDIAGDFNLTGVLVVHGKLIVGGNVNISGQLVVNGVAIFKQNGAVGGNVVANLGSTISVLGSFVNDGGQPVISPNVVVGGAYISTTASTSLNNLDLNVGGIPVGLFDLQGQDFPSLTKDIGRNPISILDFPISGGLIENLYKNGKEIKNIMTMEYSAEGKGYWRITDLTKDIDTLYGNSYNPDNEFNNDYQGIFHIRPNKAYWVNVSTANKGLRPQSLEATIDKTNSGITPQVLTHFSNTFDKGKSITTNHINHRLNIKFKDDGKFINTSEEDADYYNVVANIVGERYYLKRSGNYFSLSIDDNEMPIKETNIGNKIPIIIEAYDGTGLSLTDKTNPNYSIKFFKPEIPQLRWNNSGDLIIDDKNKQNINNNISIFEIYSPSISDVKSQRKKSLISENNLSIKRDKNTDKMLKWSYGDDSNLYGGLRVMNAIIKDKEYGFYSDIRAFIYAPLKQGHILSVNQSNKADSIPYSYISNKKLEDNNGVQLDLFKNVSTVEMAYFPQGSEGAKSLSGTGFGGSRTMFLRLNSGSTNQDVIAKISYLPSYSNKIFYIYVNKKLYQGRFADNNNFNSDSNAYNLEGRKMSVDILSRPGATQAIVGASEGISVISGTKNVQNLGIR